MSVKLLTEHHLEFLSLKGGCTGSSESALVKMPHCWKSCVTAQFSFLRITFNHSKKMSESSGYFLNLKTEIFREPTHVKVGISYLS